MTLNEDLTVGYCKLSWLLIFSVGSLLQCSWLPGKTHISDGICMFSSSLFPRLEWCSVKRHLQIGCDSQAALCFISLVGICHSLWQTSHWSFRSSWCSSTVLWRRWSNSYPTRRIRRNRHHVLYRFLPEPNCHQHNLRLRRHNFSLSTKIDDRNFIIRQLFSDSYWCVVAMTIVYLYISYLNVHSCGLSNSSIKLYYYSIISSLILLSKRCRASPGLQSAPATEWTKYSETFITCCESITAWRWQPVHLHNVHSTCSKLTSDIWDQLLTEENIKTNLHRNVILCIIWQNSNLVVY